MALTCPKCNAENDDDAYFCTQCHAHIRSAFSSPAASSSPAKPGFASAPTTTFASATAVAEPIVEEVAEVAPEQDVQNPARPLQQPVAGEEQTEDDAEQPDDRGQVTFISDGERVSLELTRPTEHKYPEVTLHEMFGPLLGQARNAQSPVIPDTTSNTSGLRDKSVLPSEAQGWSWAGFVPLGFFGFAYGMIPLGIVGLLASLFNLWGLVFAVPYLLVCGIKGRERAWRNRTFSSVQQYKDTLATWDRVGKFFLVIDVLFYIFVLLAVQAPL